MRIRRDILMVLGLFAALAAFLVLVPSDGAADEAATSHSSGPGGALALYRWLGGLGYRVERLEYRAFGLDDEAGLLVVLAPSTSYSREEADIVLRWVEAGGTLIVADSRPFGGSASLLRAIGVAVGAAQGESEQVPLLQPAAPGGQIVAGSAGRLAELPADAAALAGASGAPLLAGVRRGAGYIYLSTAVRPFTNAGLADAGSAALILGLLRRAPAGARVLFDEYHHGFVRAPSLGGLLVGSPWGWALIYIGLVGAAYVVFSGLRFGRPAPLREETARRSSGEYLESMAGLLRRGRKGGYVLAHYKQALKRRLARPLGISPSLDDAALAAAVAAARPVDAAALGALLARMGRPGVGEAELLRLIAESDRF